MVSADPRHAPAGVPQTNTSQAYCPACRQDIRKLKESARIMSALRELAEQMEGFEIPDSCAAETTPPPAK